MDNTSLHIILTLVPRYDRRDGILPLSTAAMALPLLSIRGDFGVPKTAAVRYGPSLLNSFAQMGPQGALGATKLLRPFLEVVDSLDLNDLFLRNWVDLLAFLLVGVKSNGILSAEMGHFDEPQRAPKLPSKAPREVKELDENKNKKSCRMNILNRPGLLLRP